MNESIFIALVSMAHVVLAFLIFCRTKLGIKTKAIVLVCLVLVRTLGVLEGLHANGGLL